ncbi:MAG: type IIA DNA topoisomerase subunit B [Muribaculaceae bacterium]|nr:type IIA DNA topoisomerase subunit B [Muribaculaceae bacterium]
MTTPTNTDIQQSSSTEEVYYGDDAIRTLAWNAHIRQRPGMYIGKLGDGSASDDGIYVLLKEVLDNAIDEFMMGYGKLIKVDVTPVTVTVRDYGRGIPLASLVDASAKMNTGAKYDSAVFKKSVGLNGVGIKAVNALSVDFIIESVRDGLKRRAVFTGGDLVEATDPFPTDEPNGTFVQFTPDNTLFRDYRFREEHIVPLLKNYTFLNTGLTIEFNGKKYFSRGGLLDLLKDYMTNEPLYPIIHLKGDDIEIAITHANQYGEEYYSFVNGQHTTQGGTHLTAFKESVSRTFKDYFGRASLEYSDIRNGIVCAVSIKVEEPVFESQTKTKLGSREVGPNGPTVAKFIGDFVKRELDNYLHRNLDVADVILKKVLESERERRAMAGVTKKAREQAKKISLHNKKLLDCRVHLTDARVPEEKRMASSIFITEGDSAAGSITKIRNVETQAVFSLRGKPKNTYGKTKKMVYENEEFNLLQAALNIEESIDNLRYNKVIIATDADVDGMHIRMLLLTFFLQFYPDLVKAGHVYILQTPLFRVRNKKTSKRSGKIKKGAPDDETYYCYTDAERITAINNLGTNAEITRFKGLGEISPEEFRGFIGENMRADRVSMHKEDGVAELLRFYMGKNSIERQNFIIDNLVIEDDSQIS